MTVFRILSTLFNSKFQFDNFFLKISAKVLPLIGWTLFFIILSSSSCKKLEPIAPIENYQTIERIKTLSVIPVPIQINVKDLQNIINDNLTGLLYEDSDWEKDNMLVKVWKESDISIGINGDEFFYDAPLKIWVKGKYGINQLGIDLSQTKEAEFKLKLKFKSKISLTSSWKVITHTSSLGHEWITSPVIKIGFVEIPLKMFADKIISSQQINIAKIIDGKVDDEFIMKRYADEIWRNLQEPIKIQEYPAVWLKLQPEEVSMTKLRGEGESIKTLLLLKTYSEIKIGTKPANQLSPLPDLSIGPLTDSDFYFTFDTDISYQALTNLANQYFTGKTFEFRNGKKKIKIDKVNIYGSGNKLIFDLAVSGDISGKMYLTSLPYYDSLTQTLGLKEVDFDMDTKNQILKTADWLAHGSIQKKIEANLKYPVANEIIKTKELLTKELSDRKITTNVYLKAEVNEIIPKEIFLTKESLKIIIDSKGKVNLSIKN